MDARGPPKRRKLTDKELPNSLKHHEAFSGESQMYQELLDMERKLDWTMMRKKVEIEDALTRVQPVPRTLRVFLSHTVSGQVWQQPETGDPTHNFDTGQGIPAWQLKVEGRVLELPGQRPKDRLPLPKFSHLVKRMVVEIDRNPGAYPDGNVAEWPRAQTQTPPMDGFTLRKTGDAPARIRILLYLNHQPSQYKLHPDLANLLCLKEDSRINVIHALWNYIKINGLQDKVERRIVRTNDELRALLGAETVHFTQLPEIVNRFLIPPDPIVLHYMINPATAPPERPTAWDVEVKLEDLSLKHRMKSVTLDANPTTLKTLGDIDDEIAVHIQSLHNSVNKSTFLRSFSQEPAEFIQTWLASQSRDLETVLGSGISDGATIRLEDLKRSEFFKLPWVEEAVAIQHGFELSQKNP